MDEDDFWDLISLMEGDPAPAGCHRVYLVLRKMDEAALFSFADRLAEVLHRMDLRSIAKQRWRDVSEPRWMPRIPGISADGFLYARCAAVAEGRGSVEAILADHRAFRRRWDTSADCLLSVTAQAYEGVTGKPWPDDDEITYSYETGSNPDGGWQREGYPAGNPQ